MATSAQRARHRQLATQGVATNTRLATQAESRGDAPEAHARRMVAAKFRADLAHQARRTT